MAIDKWRLDAWAVRDGAAFASRREAESLDAENTVFIAVPDLEPVPVGRLSTAISATRRGFQDGFRDLEGNEIAFDSLEQVIELIRRGFLAGGLGPNGSGAPTGRPRPGGDATGSPEDGPRNIDGPGSGGAQYYERQIEITQTEKLLWHDGPSGARASLSLIAEEANPATIAEGARSKTTTSLLSLVHAYAESITIDWEQRAEQFSEPLDTKRLVTWYQALGEVGVWSGSRDFHEFVIEHRPGVGLQLLNNWRRPPWNNPAPHELAGLPRQHLLSYAPCPRRRFWGLGLSRFADKVTLPMCVGDYFDNNRYLPELAPAVLGALILTLDSFPSALAGGARFTNARLAFALRWIASQMPQTILPDVAEKLLNDYAWRQLDGRPPAGLPTRKPDGSGGGASSVPLPTPVPLRS